MEYPITSDRPFREIEDRTMEALQRMGFVVQHTPRLAAPGGDGDRRPNPGFTGLMLYRSGPLQRPWGQVTLCGLDGQAALESLLAPRETAEAGPSGGTEDTEAELAAALSLGGLEFCVHAAGGSECIEVDSFTETDG